MIKEFTLTGVIPTHQYTNIQPSVTVDVKDGNIEAARSEAELFILDFSERYAEEGKQYKPRAVSEGPVIQAVGNPRVEKQTFTGETIYYDDLAHEYFDIDGNKLISASTWAQKFEKPFNKEFISKACEKSWGVPVADILDIWDENGNLSKLYGSTIHKAIELYTKYNTEGRKVTDAQIKSGKLKEGAPNYVLPNNEFLKQIVEEFHQLPQTQGEAFAEVFISSVKDGMAGQIDRLLEVGPETYRVQDIKTGKEIDKTKLKQYTAQISFYAHMLKQAGRDVAGGDIIYHDGKKWSVIEVELMEVKL